MKKILTILLITLCISSSVFSNGSKEENQSNDSESKQLEGFQCIGNPTTFTIFLNFDNIVFDSDWEVWKKAGDMTNIYLDGVIPKSNSNEVEAFNLMVSSGDLADIIGYNDIAVLEQLGRDGGLIPLNDLIDQYAPNIKAYMQANPDFKNSCYSLDGNIYQIPKANELFSAEFWWIRKDWLDKFNLEIPTTVDELHDALYTFKYQDANGNGKTDEVPLFDRGGFRQPTEYLSLWDSGTNFYPRDGKMTFEPLEPNFKVAMKNLSQWYSEGLLDPEYLTRGSKSRDILLSGNLGACTHDWVSTGNYNTRLAADIPGFDIVAFAPPKDQNGNQVERTFRTPVAGWGISSTCKDPVALIKYFDFFFTKEGSTLINWGIEGDTYTIDANGNKQFVEEVINNKMGPLVYLRTKGVQYRIGMVQDANYEYGFMTGEGKKATELYNTHREWYRSDMPPFKNGNVQLKYTPEDEKRYLKLMSSIDSYVSQKFTSWLLGSSDFDEEYDEFVKELKKRGIDEAISINQRAYDTYLGK